MSTFKKKYVSRLWMFPIVFLWKCFRSVWLIHSHLASIAMFCTLHTTKNVFQLKMKIKKVKLKDQPFKNVSLDLVHFKCPLPCFSRFHIPLHCFSVVFLWKHALNGLVWPLRCCVAHKMVFWEPSCIILGSIALCLTFLDTKPFSIPF